MNESITPGVADFTSKKMITKYFALMCMSC
jgi:hypothetical protein